MSAPLPESPESITRATYERIAADYCATTPSPEARASVIASLRQFIDLLKPGDRVLVLGAGDGRDAEVLLDQGVDAIALDITTAMIDLARRRIRGGSIVQADIEALPFRPAAFDGVWAGACMYHLRKAALPGAVEAVRRLLRPDGVFYMNLRRGEGERLDPAPRSYPKGGARLYSFYSWPEVVSMMDGFDLVAMRDSDPVFKEDYFQLWLRKATGGRQ